MEEFTFTRKSKTYWPRIFMSKINSTSLGEASRKEYSKASDVQLFRRRI
jgi:hypothetical protein